MGCHDETTTRKIAWALESWGVYFDAVYKKHKLTESKLFINYKQVFLDFDIDFHNV